MPKSINELLSAYVLKNIEPQEVYKIASNVGTLQSNKRVSRNELIERIVKSTATQQVSTQPMTEQGEQHGH